MMAVNVIVFLGLAAVFVAGFAAGHWWRGRKKQ